jgi:hypothetical protein
MIENECIKWPGSKSKEGYGKIKIKGRDLRAHRLIYATANGITLDEMEGLVVMHACDTPSCVNPLHLILGTTADNVADMHTKGRGHHELLERLEPCDPCRCESGRHCSECGASLDGFRRQAVFSTCSGRCRIERFRRMRYTQESNPLQKGVTP